MYRLRLFGGVFLEAEGEVVGGAAAQRHRLALLALLTVPEPRPMARDRLIALLWPESDTSRARNLLNQSIHTLRRVLGEDAIESLGDAVALDPDRIECDVHAFEAARRSGDFEAAAALYAGPFLDGFFLKDAAEFEQWASAERQRLARVYAEVLAAAAEAREAASEWETAAEWWRRAAQHDPLSSTVTLRLMRALDAAGDRPAALRHAQVHAALLREELGAEPDPAIVAFERQLREPSDAAVEVAPAPRTVRAQPGSARSIPMTWRRVSAAAALAVMGLLLAGLLVRDRERPAAGSADSREPAPGVAVLPFAVSDSVLTTWREGIVVLLSIDLEGIPGLRPIAARTVLARWGDRRADAPIEEALGVVRDVGARYAVIGSANSFGAEVVLSAEIYDAAASERLTAVRVRGSPDDILQLVDDLTLEIVRELSSAEGRLPRIDLASVTTRSVPALKAFLEGEAAYRAGRYHAAMAAYQNAVAVDSAFALAYARLANACSWAMVLSPECPRWRAAGLAGAERMPARMAAVLGAYSHESLAALQEVVEQHPDDIEAWYLLGETFEHRGAELLTTGDAAVRAFEQALALDSTFTPAYEHLILHALRDRDSARAAALMARHARIAPDDPVRPTFETGFAVVFGADTLRSRVLAGLESIDTRVLIGLSLEVLRDASFLGVEERILRSFMKRSDAQVPLVRWLLFENLRRSGRLREARAVLEDPRSGIELASVHRYLLRRAGLEDASADPRAEAGDSAPARAHALLIEGITAAERGDTGGQNEVRSALAREAANRGSDSRLFEGAMLALDGYAAWRADSAAVAIRRLERAQREYRSGEDEYPMSALNQLVRLWLGDVLAESDRPQDALRYLDTFADDPYARFEAARIHERLGDRDAARRDYEYALLAWRAADAELRPRIEAATRALERLRD